MCLELMSFSKLMWMIKQYLSPSLIGWCKYASVYDMARYGLCFIVIEMNGLWVSLSEDIYCTLPDKIASECCCIKVLAPLALLGSLAITSVGQQTCCIALVIHPIMETTNWAKNIWMYNKSYVVFKKYIISKKMNILSSTILTMLITSYHKRLTNWLDKLCNRYFRFQEVTDWPQTQGTLFP